MPFFHARAAGPGDRRGRSQGGGRIGNTRCQGEPRRTLQRSQQGSRLCLAHVNTMPCSVQPRASTIRPRHTQPPRPPKRPIASLILAVSPPSSPWATLPHGAGQDDSLAREALVAGEIGRCLNHRIGAVRDDDFVRGHATAEIGKLLPVFPRDLCAVLGMPNAIATPSPSAWLPWQRTPTDAPGVRGSCGTAAGVCKCRGAHARRVPAYGGAWGRMPAQGHASVY